MFQLHSQLESDTFFVADLPLCRVLLMNDKQFPWLILVPRRASCQEVYDLSEQDIAQYQKESIMVSKAMMQQFNGDKLNVAALGNVVPQLHIHHIVRFKHDIAWPEPIWGKQKPIHYNEAELRQMLEKTHALLQPIKANQTRL